jgi:hypothetical protein
MDPDLDPDPNPDPLVRGMDPRIRIHPKMSWIATLPKMVYKLQKVFLELKFGNSNSFQSKNKNPVSEE